MVAVSVSRRSRVGALHWVLRSGVDSLKFAICVNRKVYVVAGCFPVTQLATTPVFRHCVRGIERSVHRSLHSEYLLHRGKNV